LSGATLELRAVSKRYGDQTADDGVSLTVGAGEFLTLLGPSGSGKTTTLNAIAGFVGLTEGEVLLDGQDLSNLPPHRRGIGMVFQQYALFPHLSVADNIAFPLRQRNVSRADIRDRVDEVLRLVDLEGYGARRPRELSGGQQQRVAVARAIVFRPRLLLMDEPLGALDKNLRESLQLEIRRLHRELGITFVYVTHDQDEAVVLSDRIAVFNHGRIEQLGTPEELYERPATVFVARFLGESNTFTGRVAVEGTEIVLATDDGSLRLSGDVAAAGSPASLVVRPERMGVRAAAEPGELGENALSGVVTQVVYLGASRRIEVNCGQREVVVRQQTLTQPAPSEGERVVVSWRPEDAVLISAAADVTAQPAMATSLNEGN
jgi:putative spermidine/putrescine transport system ATP-binding protein